MALRLQSVRIHEIVRLHLLRLRVHEFLACSHAKLGRQDLVAARVSFDKTCSLLILALNQNLEWVLLIFKELFLV